MQFRLETVELDNLLLDPNNYRFYDLPQWKKRQNDRFHNDAVQEATLRLLETVTKYNISELRDSLLANGYVPLERLVVVPYAYCPDKYLVVEGNRRVAALKTLLRDHDEGVLHLSESQLVDFSTLPVALPVAAEQELATIQRVLMGIRHIAGPQEWGAYQQALLIAQLIDEEGRAYDNVAGHLGLSALETRRRYRAIRALREMENDEVYSRVALPTFYRLFHELVSLPNVREFFGWNHDEAEFDNPEKARLFYELIAPLEEDSQTKLKTFGDVRKLRVIVGVKEAEAELLDPDSTLASALAKAEVAGGTQVALDIVSEARRFLQSLSSVQLEAIATLSDDDLQLLRELDELITRRLEEHTRLTKER